ncbi:MAG TPA: hypothetical protein VK817_21730 [Trebonia sp.]|nr:hypothetical protein [Trebonia sp.]
MESRLLSGAELTSSPVVANRAMNRERQLEGPNSYVRELGFHPLDWLRARLPDARASRSEPVPDLSWLDLCCGSGRALIQAAHQLSRAGLGARIGIVGVDLVDFFVSGPGYTGQFAVNSHYRTLTTL